MTLRLLNATILHCLGIDHSQLTDRYWDKVVNGATKLLEKCWET